MRTRFKKRIKELILILLFLLLLKAFFKFIYFPTHPVTYSKYQLREDFDPNLNKNTLELLDPPNGGCFDNCWGKEIIVSCNSYTRKYDYCTFDCYGYDYNNCTSTKLGIIFGLFSR